MLATRMIPCLLLGERGLVKGMRFRDHRYIGDAMNAIRIFNKMEVDELVLVDIGATRASRTIDPELVKRMSTECQMPITVGGGVRSVEDARKLMNAGAEKITVCTAALQDPTLVRKIADTFGSQSVVVCIDALRTPAGRYEAVTHSGTASTGREVMELAAAMQEHGAGEILINSVDRDGTLAGYDLELIRGVSERVDIPVIALGGAGSLEHFSAAVREGKATAVAAGAFFVFYGRRRAVLISFPTKSQRADALSI